MKKKVLLLGLLCIGLFVLTACGNNSAQDFKNDYESVNGKENASGKVHRSVTITDDNPFVPTTAEDIVARIENKETFYVYFGSKLCPWCRSTIEKASEVALTHGIKKIYYVDIWDNEGNEILRDKYTLDENGEPKLSQSGTESYTKLLNYFDNLLSDYTLTDTNGKKVDVSEKRIFAPNYFYIEDGIAKKIATGISSQQKDSREELTNEILSDEETIFNDFFQEACDEAC